MPRSYTIALGGVAAGSMNEKEHAIVTGMAKYSGWTWRANACKKNERERETEFANYTAFLPSCFSEAIKATLLNIITR